MVKHLHYKATVKALMWNAHVCTRLRCKKGVSSPGYTASNGYLHLINSNR